MLRTFTLTEVAEALTGNLLGADALFDGVGTDSRKAVAAATAQDIVVLAGKGHEPYQEIAGVRHPFSDLDQAERALTAWERQHA